MTPRNKAKRAAWMASFQAECTRLGVWVGGDDWNSAHYFFDTGLTPAAAAERWAKGRTPEERV